MKPPRASYLDLYAIQSALAVVKADRRFTNAELAHILTEYVRILDDSLKANEDFLRKKAADASQ